MTRLDRIVALVRQHRPALSLIDKRRVRWMQAANLIMRPFMPDFMDVATVVVGDRVYLPRPPEDIPQGLLARILAHELVHQLDQAEHGPSFYLSYALWPMPLGRTARAYWERRAYAVDMMIAFHEGGEPALQRIVNGLVGVFAGPAYGWMWAGRNAARAYLEPVAEEIRSGSLQIQSPYAEILAAWTGDRGPLPSSPPTGYSGGAEVA